MTKDEHDKHAATCPARGPVATSSGLSLMRGAYCSAVSNTSTVSSHASRSRTKRGAGRKIIDDADCSQVRAGTSNSIEKKNAQWLREEAERFENERKTNASANAHEMANKKQQKKLTRSQQLGRPLTNAVYSQPALANDDEHAHRIDKANTPDET
jgi:hypothetical protein